MLGRIKGLIGAAQHFIGRIAGQGQHDARRGGAAQRRQPPDRRHLAHGSQQALEQGQQALRLMLPQQQRKLLAAPACRHVVAPDQAPQHAGKRHQHRIADLVAPLLVDALEMVDVEQHQPEAVAGLTQPVLELGRERAPVGKLGEFIGDRRLDRIVTGLAQLAAGDKEVGHVRADAQHASVGQAGFGHQDPAPVPVARLDRAVAALAAPPERAGEPGFEIGHIDDRAAAALAAQAHHLSPGRELIGLQPQRGAEARVGPLQPVVGVEGREQLRAGFKQIGRGRESLRQHGFGMQGVIV
mmetsp:Transcript_20670/g.79271  ORF Transcript_20670/g.79271 Transcript_20670/m.79271 type:complete len:298 (-) Transcript_20670:1371-2264(-)